MTIFSLVAKRIEDGGWTGVCRFDAMLRRVFPELVSVTECPKKFRPDDIVIADNHLSLSVPADTKTIIVHHGCAATHYERDPYWRTDKTRLIVERQFEMTSLPHRHCVAPSVWVADEFSRHVPNWIRAVDVIPHWVDAIGRAEAEGERPVIIGDWRDWNKGSDVWRSLAEHCPQWQFRPLSFRDDAGRRAQYGQASLYLCLSLSEGFGYGMADAEAAELPIVTTNVGAYLEFSGCEVIRWQDRDNLDLVAEAIGRKLEAGRGKPSFFRDYSFDDWAEAWRRLAR
jgi:glycosyltransferase involved in cell wall biosynthesis